MKARRKEREDVGHHRGATAGENAVAAADGADGVVEASDINFLSWNANKKGNSEEIQFSLTIDSILLVNDKEKVSTNQVVSEAGVANVSSV